VTPEQAVSAVEGGALLVDVRTPEEYATQSIPGAINVPLDTLPDAMESVPGASQDEPIVVHCQSGNRSAQATTLLCDAGYCIYDMGGIGNWPEPF
jgi:rhodanese-related sulfurtransferase